MMKAAKLPPPPKTSLEMNLGLVKSEDTLKTISTVTRNVAQKPREEKYRKLRLTNEKINKLIVETPGALASLQVMGWVQSEENEEFLELPMNVQLSMNEVRTVDSAIEKLAAEVLKEQKKRIAARKASTDPEKARLLAQMEDDKRERASNAPVTKASVATKRNEPQVMTAGDIGIGKGDGG